MSVLFRTLGNRFRLGLSIVPVREINSCPYDNARKPRPKPYEGQFWRIVHYEDEYTVKPLNVTNLAGRDPVTGRKVAIGIGGGIKHKYHWIQWKRSGPTEDVPPLEEKVIQILDDGHRTAKIALVAGGKEMKYYLATENMKAGDIIKTSSYIPPIPVLAKEGDAYPLGALVVGTKVHNIEKFPGAGGFFIRAAGSSGTIVRKQKDNKVAVKMPSKHEMVFDVKCMATVGRLSNVLHSQTPIGSAQRLRELGYRPRSGLWHRKTGRFGRKIKRPKTYVIAPKIPQPPVVMLDE